MNQDRLIFVCLAAFIFCIGQARFAVGDNTDPNNAPATVKPAKEEPKPLGITLDGTYVSKYVWRGYEIFNNHAAFQPSINWDLFGSGFSVNVWGAIPCGSSAGQDLTETDYTVGYATQFFVDGRWAVDFRLNYIYYDYPRVNSKFVPDAEELGGGISWPKLIPLGDSALVPGYYFGRLFTSQEHLDPDTNVEGMYHEFSLSYELTIPKIERPLNLSWSIGYNDGMYGADHDWSHTTLGLSTAVELKPFTVKPFVNYQVSLDNSVNDEDIFYGGVSISTSF